MCEVTPSHVWRDSFTCVTWLLHMCDVTPSHVWRDYFTCVTLLIHMCDVTPSHVWQDPFICLTGLLHTCYISASRVWPVSFTCVTWLLHMCDVTHSHVWHDPFTCVTCLLHMCDITPLHVWGDTFTCVTWLLHMCDMTPSHVGDDSYASSHWTWSLREIGVSTHEEDQTENIWISRFAGFSGHSFEWRGLHLLTWNPLWNLGDSQKNVFDMYGDSYKNLFQIFSRVNSKPDLLCLWFHMERSLLTLTKRPSHWVQDIKTLCSLLSVDFDTKCSVSGLCQKVFYQWTVSQHVLSVHFVTTCSVSGLCYNMFFSGLCHNVFCQWTLTQRDVSVDSDTTCFVSGLWHFIGHSVHFMSDVTSNCAQRDSLFVYVKRDLSIYGCSVSELNVWWHVNKTAPSEIVSLYVSNEIYPYEKRLIHLYIQHAPHPEFWPFV